MKPRLLDLFCGAGGAAKGYQRAGFYVVGVDIKPQPRYCGDEFHQADALTFMCDFVGGSLDNWPEICDRCGKPFSHACHAKYDAIHASPPCEHYSQCTPKRYRDNHADLIAPARELLMKSGARFVIENVPSAARLLRNPLMLCGSMFGLQVQRHRFFELSFPVASLFPPCDHSKPPVLITGTHRRTWEPRYEYTAQQCRDAADLQWMRRVDMDKAIPPAYTEWIGRQLLAVLERAA